MAIYFYTEGVKFNLNQKAKVKNWLKLVAEKNKHTTGTINFIFTNDELLLEKNINFLNHTTYTDIITFDYTEGNKISGDIFISVDRVNENAQKFKVDFYTELYRVLTHGVLHLCGYKDKTVNDAKLMRKKENESLKLMINL
ncbi:MAG: rRNA maturation RNase YbeY [Bacteroidetes bacterium]|nr:rRNA maturation RNase YbeY [Bacteroidota bacterium]